MKHSENFRLSLKPLETSLCVPKLGLGIADFDPDFKSSALGRGQFMKPEKILCWLFLCVCDTSSLWSFFNAANSYSVSHLKPFPGLKAVLTAVLNAKSMNKKKKSLRNRKTS